MSQNNRKALEKKEVPDKSDTELIIDDSDNKKDCEKQYAELIASFHSGPLPPPETLKGYNEILPDAVERIFCMAENFQLHAHDMDKLIAKGEALLTSRGQIFALIIASLGIVGAVICAVLNEPIVGSVIGGSSMASIVANFLSVRKEKKEESKRNKDDSEEK